MRANKLSAWQPVKILGVGERFKVPAFDEIWTVKERLRDGGCLAENESMPGIDNYGRFWPYQDIVVVK